MEAAGCAACGRPYDLAARRPKLAPCGHAACLDCIQRDQRQRCPTCSEEIVQEASELPSPFAVMEKLAIEANRASRSLWCVDCQAVATPDCEDAHTLWGLRRALRHQTEQMQSHVDALAREWHEACGGAGAQRAQSGSEDRTLAGLQVLAGVEPVVCSVAFLYAAEPGSAAAPSSIGAHWLLAEGPTAAEHALEDKLARMLAVVLLAGGRLKSERPVGAARATGADSSSSWRCWSQTPRSHVTPALPTSPLSLSASLQTSDGGYDSMSSATPDAAPAGFCGWVANKVPSDGQPAGTTTAAARTPLNTRMDLSTSEMTDGLEADAQAAGLRHTPPAAAQPRALAEPMGGVVHNNGLGGWRASSTTCSGAVPGGATSGEQAGASRLCGAADGLGPPARDRLLFVPKYVGYHSDEEEDDAERAEAQQSPAAAALDCGIIPELDVHDVSTSGPERHVAVKQGLLELFASRGVRRLLGLHCDKDVAWSTAVLRSLRPADLEELDTWYVNWEQLELVHCALPALRMLSVAGDRSVGRSEARLAPLPAHSHRLEKLVVSNLPRAALQSLLTAHCDSLATLWLWAGTGGSEDRFPYSGGDLGKLLGACGLRALRLLVLQRDQCVHFASRCLAQRSSVRGVLPANVEVLCGKCDSIPYEGF